MRQLEPHSPAVGSELEGNRGCYMLMECKRGSNVSYLHGNTLQTKIQAHLLRLPAALSSLERFNTLKLMFKPLNDKLQHNIISIDTLIRFSPEASSLSKGSIWPNVSLTTISYTFYPKTHLDNFSLCFSPYEIR